MDAPAACSGGAARTQRVDPNAGLVRVQLRRTKAWRMPANTLKVDRTTRWGNPFTVAGAAAQSGARDAAGAVEAFRALMLTKLRVDPTGTRAALAPLRGHNLACWCKLGTPCHADILANAPEV
jgi:hypothetical protein